MMMMIKVAIGRRRRGERALMIPKQKKVPFCEDLIQGRVGRSKEMRQKS
jgi:hypothetical protein